MKYWPRVRKFKASHVQNIKIQMRTGLIKFDGYSKVLSANILEIQANLTIIFHLLPLSLWIPVIFTSYQFKIIQSSTLFENSKGNSMKILITSLTIIPHIKYAYCFIACLLQCLSRNFYYFIAQTLCRAFIYSGEKLARSVSIWSLSWKDVSWT